jgi:hypothetical protein
VVFYHVEQKRADGVVSVKLKLFGWPLGAHRAAK